MFEDATSSFFEYTSQCMIYIFKKSDRKGWLTERKIVDEKNASMDYRKNSAISISTIFLFDDVGFGINFGDLIFR
jgi:hypothetical protein